MGRGVRWVRTSVALSGPKRHSHLPVHWSGRPRHIGLQKIGNSLCELTCQAAQACKTRPDNRGVFA